MSQDGFGPTTVPTFTLAMLLDAAPFGGCVFCGYNGANYFRAGTHRPRCPWFSVGGYVERVAALPAVLRGFLREGPLGSAPQPRINTPCPSCGHRSLFIGSGGWLTCAVLGCANPLNVISEFAHVAGAIVMMVLQDAAAAKRLRVDFDAKGPYVSGWRE